MTAVLAIRGRTVAKLQLGGDNVLDLLVLHSGQLRLGDLALLRGDLLVEKLPRTEQRAQVLGTEGRTLVQLRGHDELVSLGSALAMLIVLQFTVPITGTVLGREEKGKDRSQRAKGGARNQLNGDETTFAVVLSPSAIPPHRLNDGHIHRFPRVAYPTEVGLLQLRMVWSVVGFDEAITHST